MATKKNVMSISATKTMAEAKAIYDTKGSATFVDLVGAMGAYERAEKIMGGHKKDLKQQIDVYAPEQVVFELDSYKTAPDQEVVIEASGKKYKAKTAKVLSTDIDSAEILKLHGLVDPKYFSVSIVPNKEVLIADALAGVLPPALAPFVTVSEMEQLKISSSAIKSTSSVSASSFGATYSRGGEE